MTNPLLNKLMFSAVALMAALGVPYAGGWLTYTHTSSLPLAVLAAAAVVYQLMALSVAAASLWQYVPEQFALGPSFLAGHGLLTLGMMAMPLLLLPGLVWLYVLPFDEHGYFKRGAVLGLDPAAFEEPHHAGGDSA